MTPEPDIGSAVFGAYRILAGIALSGNIGRVAHAARALDALEHLFPREIEAKMMEDVG